LRVKEIRKSYFGENVDLSSDGLPNVVLPTTVCFYVDSSNDGLTTMPVCLTNSLPTMLFA